MNFTKKCWNIELLWLVAALCFPAICSGGSALDWYNKIKEPRSIESLNQSFDGPALEFLLGIREGNVARATKAAATFNYTAEDAEDEIADPFGTWEMHPGFPSFKRWGKDAKVKIYELDGDANTVITEAYLQATISDNDEIWRTFHPFFEKLVFSRLSFWILGEGGEMDLRRLFSGKVDPNSPIAVYRIDGHRVVREPIVCYLATSGYSFITELVRLGAAPDITCDSGHTPLGLAIWSGWDEIVSDLLKTGANPNMRSKGYLPLEMAEELQDKDLIELLIRFGAKSRKALNSE